MTKETVTTAMLKTILLAIGLPLDSEGYRIALQRVKAANLIQDIQTETSDPVVVGIMNGLEHGKAAKSNPEKPSNPAELPAKSGQVEPLINSARIGKRQHVVYGCPSVGRQVMIKDGADKGLAIILGRLADGRHIVKRCDSAGKVRGHCLARYQSDIEMLGDNRIEEYQPIETTKVKEQFNQFTRKNPNNVQPTKVAPQDNGSINVDEIWAEHKPAGVPQPNGRVRFVLIDASGNPVVSTSTGRELVFRANNSKLSGYRVLTGQHANWSDKLANAGFKLNWI